MGKPTTYNNVVFASEYIGCKSEPAELKHLSRQRKRNQNEIPIVAASELGRAQTGVFRLRGCRANHIGMCEQSRTLWKVRRYRVIAPYAKV